MCISLRLLCEVLRVKKTGIGTGRGSHFRFGVVNDGMGRDGEKGSTRSLVEENRLLGPKECFTKHIYIYNICTITTLLHFRQFVQREFITATTPVFKDI